MAGHPKGFRTTTSTGQGWAPGKLKDIKGDFIEIWLELTMIYYWWQVTLQSSVFQQTSCWQRSQSPWAINGWDQNTLCQNLESHWTSYHLTHINQNHSNQWQLTTKIQSSNQHASASSLFRTRGRRPSRNLFLPPLEDGNCISLLFLQGSMTMRTLFWKEWVARFTTLVINWPSQHLTQLDFLPDRLGPSKFSWEQPRGFN